jgi:hypothetical protein
MAATHQGGEMVGDRALGRIIRSLSQDKNNGFDVYAKVTCDREAHAL